MHDRAQVPELSALGIRRPAGIQHSLWLCVVTMTTVGYGDYAPKSLGGFIIMCLDVVLNGSQ